MALAAYLGIEVKHAMRKQVIKNTLIDRLVTEDLLDEECLKNKVEILDSSDELPKLQIQEQERRERFKIE